MDKNHTVPDMQVQSAVDMSPALHIFGFTFKMRIDQLRKLPKRQRQQHGTAPAPVHPFIPGCSV